MNRKCLAIGVSTVEPVAGGSDFPYLDGAIDAAETIGQWARKSGFADSDVIVVTDKDKAVTEQTIKDAFTALLPVGSPTDHLIVSFAGHGQTGMTDDITYWLMSDSLEEGYQIFVEEMKRQLHAYDVRHLTIFSDACRAITAAADLRLLVPRTGVQKRNPNPAPAAPQLARYNACPDATKAFMVRNPTGAARGKCIFSGVLAEALWGRVPEALDGDVIDSSSLGRGLGVAVSQRARDYGLDLVSGGSACFDKLIYFDKATPPGPPDPDLSPWPAASSVETASAGAKRGGMVIASASKISPLPPGFPRSDNVTLGADGGSGGGGGGVLSSLSDIAVVVGGLAGLAGDGIRAITELPRRRRANKRARAEQAELDTAVAARAAQQRRADTLGVSLRETASATTSRTAELVTDSPVKQIWSDAAVAIAQSAPTQFILPDAACQLFVEFTDGKFAPVWHYPGLSCTLVREAKGVAALTYRRAGTTDRSGQVAGEAITRMVTGQLSAEAIDALAADLRNDKHVNPVLGAIATYCYDITGDLDSIRRMAWFYQANGQAAPYDLIFLSLVESDGRIATVPGVPADPRRPHTGPAWLWSATQTEPIAIAGRCPWLRQGWDFLAAADDIEQPMVQGLLDLRAHLQPSTFTTFDAIGGQEVVRRWGLTPHLPG